MVERDCNTCAYHIQGAKWPLMCENCLSKKNLPHWTPDVATVYSYQAAIIKRHGGETMEEGYDY